MSAPISTYFPRPLQEPFWVNFIDRIAAQPHYPPSLTKPPPPPPHPASLQDMRAQISQPRPLTPSALRGAGVGGLGVKPTLGSALCIFAVLVDLDQAGLWGVVVGV